MRDAPGRRRPVLVAALGPARRLVLEAAAGCRGLEVVRHCDDVAELRAAAAAGVGDVAVVCAELPGLGRGVVTGMREVGVSTLGIGTSPEGRIRLRRMGVDDVLDVEASADDVAGRLLAVVSPRAGAVDRTPPATDRRAERTWPGAPLAAGGGPEASWREVGADDLALLLDPRPGPVVAVWGPTGAPGRTTMAVTLAAAAARGRTVLLVDADPYGGATAAHFGLLDEAPGLARAVTEADAGRLDAPGLQRLVTSVAPGLGVLTGLPTARRWPQLRPAGLEAVLDLARDVADLVVLDTGFSVEDDEELSYDSFAPRRNGATLTALRCADRLVVVGQAGPVGLPRLAEAVASLGRLGRPPELASYVVVNRVREAAHGPDAGRAVPAELRRLGTTARDVHVVPDDVAAVDAALRLGRPLPDSAPDSPVTRAVISLLDVVGRPDAPGRPGNATMTTCPIA